MLNNPRHEKFCLEYAACGNATEAYLKAGYGGQKRKTKNVAAFNLLKKPKIAERIKELTAWFAHIIDEIDGDAGGWEVARQQ